MFINGKNGRLEFGLYPWAPEEAHTFEEVRCRLAPRVNGMIFCAMRRHDRPACTPALVTTQVHFHHLISWRQITWICLWQHTTLDASLANDIVSPHIPIILARIPVPISQDEQAALEALCFLSAAMDSEQQNGIAHDRQQQLDYSTPSQQQQQQQQQRGPGRGRGRGRGRPPSGRPSQGGSSSYGSSDFESDGEDWPARRGRGRQRVRGAGGRRGGASGGRGAPGRPLGSSRSQSDLAGAASPHSVKRQRSNEFEDGGEEDAMQGREGALPRAASVDGFSLARRPKLEPQQQQQQPMDPQQLQASMPTPTAAAAGRNAADPLSSAASPTRLPPRPHASGPPLPNGFAHPPDPLQLQLPAAVVAASAGAAAMARPPLPFPLDALRAPAAAGLPPGLLPPGLPGLPGVGSMPPLPWGGGVPHMPLPPELLAMLPRPPLAPELLAALPPLPPPHHLLQHGAALAAAAAAAVAAGRPGVGGDVGSGPSGTALTGSGTEPSPRVQGGFIHVHIAHFIKAHQDHLERLERKQPQQQQQQQDQQQGAGNAGEEERKVKAPATGPDPAALASAAAAAAAELARPGGVPLAAGGMGMGLPPASSEGHGLNGVVLPHALALPGGGNLPAHLLPSAAAQLAQHHPALLLGAMSGHLPHGLGGLMPPPALGALGAHAAHLPGGLGAFGVPGALAPQLAAASAAAAAPQQHAATASAAAVPPLRPNLAAVQQDLEAYARTLGPPPPPPLLSHLAHAHAPHLNGLIGAHSHALPLPPFPGLHAHALPPGLSQHAAQLLGLHAASLASAGFAPPPQALPTAALVGGPSGGMPRGGDARLAAPAAGVR